ncbi:EthD family reductase [Trinickia fusca]|uniref:EthD family reductase n=1 Tax=Trinickia fusca TaxID=2419777 RepID=A0A494XJQ2_9BURK|nr:EthD family reductase [Trinickia fusca]RKP50808.1 EthD family reductase [Trinickia fusca]
MIKVSILYPYREGGRFDFDYYRNVHMPLAAKRFGATLRGWSIDAGINGGPPDTKPPFVAAGHFVFDSVDAFYAVFTPAVAEELIGDIPNYTDGGNGTIFISEIDTLGQVEAAA